MPIKDVTPPECVCDDAALSVDQTIFLGLSISSFSANLGWDSQLSSVDVVLVEDSCSGNSRKAYDECLNVHTITTPDQGFYGENRYQRLDGSYYSNCVAESGSDTLVRAKMNLIGLPVYFRVGAFEYSGILTEWNKSEQCPGIPTYNVKIVDPKIILQGTYLIIGDYSGSVAGAIPVLSGGTGCPSTNLFNVFGFMEQFGMFCPAMVQCTTPGNYSRVGGCTPSIDGVVFGTPFNGFGGAYRNENGMPWLRIAQGFNALANSLPASTNDFSPYGRVAYIKSEIPPSLTGQAYGLIASNESANPCYDINNYYFVDISELPVTPVNYRFSGTTVSMMDIIEQLSRDFGFNYYVELIPIKDESEGAETCVQKFIKIRVVYRTSVVPTDNYICSFLTGKCATSKNVGQELRTETSSKFIVGANKHTVYQAYNNTNPDTTFSNPNNDAATLASLNSCTGMMFGTTNANCPEIDDTIIPYFGKNWNGSIIVPCKDADGFWFFEAPTFDINESFKVFNISPPFLVIGEKELQAALSGFDDWKSYIQVVGTDTWGVISTQGGSDAIRGFDYLDKLYNNLGKILPRDIAAPFKSKFKNAMDNLEGDILDDEQTLFDWVAKYARDYYGRQFAVRVPFSCCWGDVENNQLMVNEVPTNDGGWTEVSTVLGLANNNPAIGTFYDINFFRGPDDRIQPFVRVGTVLDKDMSQYNVEDYMYVGNILYVRASVDEQYVFHNPLCCYGPRVVVSLPQAVFFHNQEDEGFLINNLDALATLYGNNNALPDVPGFVQAIKDSTKYPGSENSRMKLQKRASMIEAAAIPIRHESLSYGPWYNPSVTGGTVEMVKDESLAPWNFGSYAVMNTAGQFLANSARTDMIKGEAGSIEVPGYPDMPLGAELGAKAGGFYGGGQYLAENRTLTTDSYTEKSYAGLDYSGLATNPSGVDTTVNYGYFEYAGNTWTGIYGPNITSINVNVSNCSATTRYTMRTFSPRKLGTDRWLVDQIQKFSVNTRKNVDEIRARLISLSKMGKTNASTSQILLANLPPDKKDRKEPKGAVAKKAEPQLAITGSHVKHANGTVRPAVVSNTVEGTIEELQREYQSKAFMSLDGFYRPVSMDGDGGLPRYIRYDNLAGAAIAQDDLNPITNPTSVGNRNYVATTRSDTGNIGHDIDILARWDTPPSGGVILPIAGAAKNAPDVYDYAPDYRFMALRGPLVLQQWGYDCNGYPVPNKNDIEADCKIGQFKSDPNDLDPDKFLDGHLRKSDTWAVAPVDLRLDRDRGVWVAATCGGDFKFTANQNCMVDNFGRELNTCDYVSTAKKICFGPGITLEVPCSNPLETNYTLDPVTGEWVVCNGNNASEQLNYDVLKIGSHLEIVYSGIEDGCLYDQYLVDAPSFPPEDPDGPYFWGGKINQLRLGTGFITKRGVDPCTIHLSTKGITNTIQMYDTIWCEPGVGDFGESIMILKANLKTWQFECGLLVQDPIELNDIPICFIPLTPSGCCDGLNPEFGVHYIDTGVGNALGAAKEGTTYTANANDNSTIELGFAALGGNRIILGVTAVGDYFDAVPTITPTLPTTVTSGAVQPITITTNTTPSASTIRTGIITIDVSGYLPFTFGIQGIVS